MCRVTDSGNVSGNTYCTLHLALNLDLNLRIVAKSHTQGVLTESRSSWLTNQTLVVNTDTCLSQSQSINLDFVVERRYFGQRQSSAVLAKADELNLKDSRFKKSRLRLTLCQTNKLQVGRLSYYNSFDRITPSIAKILHGSYVYGNTIENIHKYNKKLYSLRK